jgi:hypothetical protein
MYTTYFLKFTRTKVSLTRQCPKLGINSPLRLSSMKRAISSSPLQCPTPPTQFPAQAQLTLLAQSTTTMRYMAIQTRRECQRSSLQQLQWKVIMLTYASVPVSPSPTPLPPMSLTLPPPRHPEHLAKASSGPSGAFLSFKDIV